MQVHLNRRARRGLTLIELVVVVAILAVLAGLVIPKLSFLQARAGSATAAATTAQLVSNVETYKTAVGGYPLGLDSLLQSGSVLPSIFTHMVDMGGSSEVEVGLLSHLETLAADDYASSLGHSFGPNSDGEVYFYDHSTSTSYKPSDSGVTRRVFDSSTDNFVALKIPTTAVPGPPSTNTMLRSLYQSLGYPSGQAPTGTRLIVLGIGPNTNLKTTIAAAPRHQSADDDSYGRYLAVFAVHEDGTAATLKGVLDPYGGSIDSNIRSYTNQAPENL